MFPRVLVAVALVAALLTVPSPGGPPPAAAAPPGERDVIAQLFQWNWDSVGRECRDTLGPAGYGAVQVSPPSEHVVLGGEGHPWWQDYQPVSYELDNRRGDRAAFAAMVADYHDRYEVQNCELLNLADLDTGAPYVRDRIGGYLNDLLSLGVDGFRVDAAKHMAAGDVAAVLDRLDGPAYIYQEVLHGAGEPVTPDEYLGNGDVYDERYARDLARIFDSERLAYLRDFGTAVPSEQVIAGVDNHDSQRGGSTLSFRDGARFSLANAFMLAWPVGTPRVMSSYSFTDFDQGPPSDVAGDTLDADCSSAAWQCEHAWQPIRNMVGFHNEVGDAPVTRWWDNGGDTIAFGRGDRGYVVLNDEAGSVGGRWFATDLPQGTYCDVLHGDPVDGGCTGPTYQVNADGWFRADIGAHDGVALHTGARVTG
ncbi:alpha-amylase [Saccharomonospora halophila]|uniref:alpha-amylase n=1 Tax=Saccharomonospora halophila TaxID=129922 RepID=UPI0003744767|nr:alpha-amylase family protein [Saccharomonospora halophila]